MDCNFKSVVEHVLTTYITHCKHLIPVAIHPVYEPRQHCPLIAMCQAREFNGAIFLCLSYDVPGTELLQPQALSMINLSLRYHNYELDRKNRMDTLTMRLHMQSHFFFNFASIILPWICASYFFVNDNFKSKHVIMTPQCVNQIISMKDRIINYY